MAEFQTIGAGRVGTRSGQLDVGLRAHMNKVYGTMSVGMLITGLAAWALSGLALSSVPTEYQIGAGKYLTQFGYAIYASPLKWVVALLPLGMVFGFGAVLNRLSAAGAQLYFYAYALAVGLSLSSIFVVFTGVSIAQTFLITAIGFASLSLWGYTTQRDISGWGSFLIMGVIGLLVAMVVNWFLASSAVSMAISVIGLLIFAGLTAYDTQQIKSDYVAHASAMDTEWLGKSAIMGALKLYLDFINMFVMLLQLFGNRN